MASEGKRRWKARTAEGAPSEGCKGREEQEQAAEPSRKGRGGPPSRRQGPFLSLRFSSSENKE